MDERESRASSREEQDRAVAEEVPDRANVAIPVNAEVAANVLSSGADASAHGSQDVSSRQTK
jgi:hypothetical protein